MLRSLLPAVGIVLGGSLASAQFIERFEAPIVPGLIHGQGSWLGWDGNPDPSSVVVNTPIALSATNVLSVSQRSDIVHDLGGPYTSGKWLLRAQSYVTSGFTGTSYFIVLNDYNAGGPYNWSLQCKIGSGMFSPDWFGGSMVTTTGGDQPIVFDTWTEIRCYIDLDSDSAELFYNGVSMYQFVWSAGTNGGGTATIDAIDLYANMSSQIAYDNVFLEPANTVCDYPADLGAMTGTGVVSYDTCDYVTDAKQPAACTTGIIHRDSFYSWTAPFSGDFVFDTCGSVGDTRIAIYDGGDCSATCIAENDDSCGLQSSITLVGVTAGEQFLIQLGQWSSSLVVCDPAGFNISGDPCAPSNDDSFEENDDCGFEVHLGSGVYSGLFTTKTDWDYYAFTVADGATLQVDLTFTHANGDIDMFLYDAGACAPFGAGDVGTTGSLASGFSSTNNESLSWTNSTGAVQTYILKVNVWPPTTTADCNFYDMTVSGTSGSTLGSPYCSNGEQNPNSTGLVARIQAVGSLAALDDDLSLVAWNLPMNEIGMFVWSTSADMINLPALMISDGFNCLGTGKGRFNGIAPNQGMILNSGATGSFALVGIDTTIMPQSSQPPIPIVAGLTGYFQGWFRDSAGTFGNNFTDAVEVTWN